MAAIFQNAGLFKFRRRVEHGKPATASEVQLTTTDLVEHETGFDIEPSDPLYRYFLNSPGACQLDALSLEQPSPALVALKESKVKVVVPLVSQGELVGLIRLGERKSQQDYSREDLKLLSTLATQTAPVVQVAQLVEEQKRRARERERIEYELKVARLIQQTLLPKDLPALLGWHLNAFYQPAREVGGDFYDFLYFDDGTMGIVIGDVTDKGVPAALVMATTRSILRGAAQNSRSPGEVLAQTNEQLFLDIPPKMFVTCLYALLDPNTGHLQFANAGHDLPYLKRGSRATQLKATGMPLGLMPGMFYEESEIQLEEGDCVLFYSDGLVEAHDPNREMFGFPRLGNLIGYYDEEKPLNEYLLDHLASFTGQDWEQEDDITMVTLQFDGGQGISMVANATPFETTAAAPVEKERWESLGEWQVASAPGNEREAVDKIVERLRFLEVPTRALDRLKTAIGETVMNAMEHGNRYLPDKPVLLKLKASENGVLVSVTDYGDGATPEVPQVPDIDAKLAGLQTVRGWGLFLVEKMVDELRDTRDETSRMHTVELIVRW
ncbi:MAG TPA: SpoIIE family protein phosphatase [Chloroflexia bacterium]|nr:SpoIIE family protein phosphatase [Chloroflexia bacterium]